MLMLRYEERVFGHDACTDCMSRVAVLAPRSICAKQAFPSCTPSRASAPTSYVSILPVVSAKLISSRSQQDHMGTTVDLQCPLEHSLIIFIRRPWHLIYQLLRYFLFGDGWFLTAPSPARAGSTQTRHRSL